MVLLGLPCEEAAVEDRQAQGYGLGVPAAQTPCDHQRKVAVLQSGTNSAGYLPWESLEAEAAAEVQVQG